MSEPTLEDRFHLIGIGGAGMSVVAELLASRGATVEGSDREDSAVLEHLRSVGVRVFVGHEASHVDPDSVVVVSTAIREDNPELAIARTRGQLVIHRSQALALAATGMRFVGVAGAHGKTSTSGMLAIALAACGLDPSVAVGGVLPQLGTGAHLGGGDVFVAEADESDGSFLNYSPAIEIVTNVEPDHLDRYHSREEFEHIFVEFARRLVPGGLLVTCGEDEGAVRLAAAARAQGLRVVTYGRPERALCEVDVEISDVRVKARGATARLAWGERHAELVMSVPGEHNVLNAAGAWVAGSRVRPGTAGRCGWVGPLHGCGASLRGAWPGGQPPPVRRLCASSDRGGGCDPGGSRRRRWGAGDGRFPAAPVLAHPHLCGAFRACARRRGPCRPGGHLRCPRGPGAGRGFDADFVARSRRLLRGGHARGRALGGVCDPRGWCVRHDGRGFDHALRG